ncbi:MAG: hypothetical protein EOQ33_28435 [Mesorhizobium sp.]|nr:MAG: hypothetical protein EOQ33_28435 [Mesorhizobium sp.]
MSSQGRGSGFAIEVRERYRNVVQERWPVAIEPRPDELLSSWLHRLAFANGVAPRSFAGVLGRGEGMWSARLDLQVPHDVMTLLKQQAAVAAEALSAMTMAGQVLTPLLLPLRENAGRNRSTWMQYCPLCFVADEAPYFRRRWRLATRISCFVHGCGLRDRCPACRSGIASFGQSELIPQHFCARCGFDLRRAAKVSVNAAARLLERCIDDICKVEMAKGSTMIGSLVSRLLRAPVVAGVGSGKTLTNLSAAARIRCFEQLAAKPYDWLVAGNDTAAAHWRRLILDAGGHDGLVARLADFMEKDRTSATPERFRLPDADLPALLEAYLRVIGVKAR